MRVYKHYQFQVILKPAPLDVQEQYLDSLRAFGIDPLEHDIRFEEDNWESPTLGAAGVGWQVVMDGMEISQFTYFQQAGGLELSPVSVELTYGIERICTVPRRLHPKALARELIGDERGDIRFVLDNEDSKTRSSSRIG